MSFIHETKSLAKAEIEKYARRNVDRKLEEMGIDRAAVGTDQYEELVRKEKEILEHDAKKVGLGVGIGIALSLLTGF